MGRRSSKQTGAQRRGELVSYEEIATFWYKKLEECPEIADMGIYIKSLGEDTLEIDGVWQAVGPAHGTWLAGDALVLGLDRPWPGGQPWPLPPAGLAANVATLAEMERRDAAERAAARLAEESYVELKLAMLSERIYANLSVTSRPHPAALPTPSSLHSSFPSPPSPPSSIGDDFPDLFDYSSASDPDFLADFY
jgi:hypothetical protein